MDFGRTKDFASLELTLPPDHPGVAKVLGGSRAQSPRAFVGGVLWADESFKGTIYPQTAKPKEYISHYTRQFNTIELNLTHYRTPEPDVVQRWRQVAPEGFRYCPKVHQDISHAPDLHFMVKQHNDCGALFCGLGERLGVQFMQLPPHFEPKRLSELLDFLAQSTPRSFALELRHAKWFGGGTELNTLCNFLYRNSMSLVLTDTPGRRDVLHMRLTNRTAFIRFNANDGHPSDKTRMDEWIARLKQWFDLGLETLYFFVHSPHQVNMPGLVAYFTEQLRLHCGISIPPPLIRQNTQPGELF